MTYSNNGWTRLEDIKDTTDESIGTDTKDKDLKPDTSDESTDTEIDSIKNLDKMVVQVEEKIKRSIDLTIEYSDKTSKHNIITEGDVLKITCIMDGKLTTLTGHILEIIESENSNIIKMDCSTNYVANIQYIVCKSIRLIEKQI